MPTPMMVPSTSEVAWGNPSDPFDLGCVWSSGRVTAASGGFVMSSASQPGA